MEDKLKELESRLQNTEVCLIGLSTFLIDLQPPAYQDAIGRMMEDYFNANAKLGSKSNESSGFI